MRRRPGVLITIAVVSFAAATSNYSDAWSSPQAPGSPKKQDPDDWIIPDSALTERNPLEPTTQVLEAGGKIYKQHCDRCHGPEGKGDGPDADRDKPPEDLTNPKRARMNPDGVIFWKIWNGRKKPEMPPLKAELTKEQVWQVVLYTQALRKPRK